MEPTAKYYKDLQPTIDSRDAKCSSSRRSSLEPYRVLNREPCPLSAFYPYSGRNSFSIRDKVREEEERAHQNLQEMQRHLERISVAATNGEHTEDIEKEERIVKLVSRLEESNSEKDNIISQFYDRLSNLEEELESKKRETKHWKNEHRSAEKRNLELIEKMAAKAREQKQRSSEVMEGEASNLKVKYDQLVQKVGELADENDQLLAECLRLEAEAKHQDQIGQMDELQEENAMLNQSLEEAAQLIHGMNEKMTKFVQVHKSTVQCYEEKLATLDDKTNKAGYFSKINLTCHNSEKMDEELLLFNAVPRDTSEMENENLHTEGIGLATIAEESEESSKTFSDISSELEDSVSEMSESDESFDVSYTYSSINDSEDHTRLAMNTEYLSKSLEMNHGLLRSLVQQTSYNEDDDYSTIEYY